MAETWRARWVGDAGVSKSVLIKKVLPEFANDDAFISMFISEARISATLSHGNIAQVFDFGRVDGQYYLAMELVDGQPLHRVLKRAQRTGLQTLPIPLAVYVVLEMCRGLHYAHTRTDDKGKPLGIVHRDISPDNVLISYEGQVKIVDFGIAKARMQRNFSTEPGVVKGKFLYFSPEQARGQEVDARTDVWATGLVLYELLCGQMPVEGTPTVVMMRMARGEFPSPKEVRKDIPSALNEIVMRALSVSLEGRFESANAFGDALAAFLYSFAPRFSPMNLAYLIRVLFRGDIAVEGRELAVPQSFIEELALWRTGGTAMSTTKPPAPRKLLPERIAMGAVDDDTPTTLSPAHEAVRLPTTLRELPIVTDREPSVAGPSRRLLVAGVVSAALLGGVAVLPIFEPHFAALRQSLPSMEATPAVAEAPVQGQVGRHRGNPNDGDRRLVQISEAPGDPGEARLAGKLAEDSQRERRRLSMQVKPPKPASRPDAPVELKQKMDQVRTLLREKRYSEALVIGEECLARSPLTAECHLWVGAALARLERPFDASTHYKRFIELAPHDDPRREQVRTWVAEWERSKE